MLTHKVLLGWLLGILLFSSVQAEPLDVKKEDSLRILNFQGDNGFPHPSKEDAALMLEELGEKNSWDIVTTSDSGIFTLPELIRFDAVVFNNNCGNAGRIFSDVQQQAFQQYIRQGGGFVGVHCAGAIWHEGGGFQQWYQRLIGTKLLDHPKVQPARIVLEDRKHISTQHLPASWTVRDEWHRLSFSPRDNVHVLASLDESSYEGEQKMGGDHPLIWYQNFDGGKSFFSSLGHTKEIYRNKDFKKIIEGGIRWVSNSDAPELLPVVSGLLLDLDADHSVEIEDGYHVSAWHNQILNTEAKVFVKQDEGREVPGSGRPTLKLSVPELNGHNSLVFHQGELVCFNEDAFDGLTQGSGYTWLSVMSVYEQRVGVVDVNSFFGNLRNTNIDRKGRFEGFWGGLTDDNRLWMGSRNGSTETTGRWNHNNPYVLANEPIETTKYYIVAGRMKAGLGKVKTQLFLNDNQPIAEALFPVNPHSNPSKMVIGQERDATNHPGYESFDGEIARFLIYDRPLSDTELSEAMNHLAEWYGIDISI